MKAKNLKILKRKGFNVPNFIIVNKKDIPNLITITYELKPGKYAVRSSCSLEDNDKESHAGEFKTFLNVKNTEIENRVNEVFDSFNEENGRVIIQEMIDADISGVIFTANPLGILNEVVVVAAKGLGNNVVNDSTYTSTYYYNINDKLYYNTNQNILSSKILKELIEIALKIKKVFKSHQDIEFAIKDNKIYILQSRPITTIGKPYNIIVLDNSNIVESYPGISLPLTQDFAKEIYYKVFRQLALRLTDDKKVVKNLDNSLMDMVDTVNGRIYYRISNWYSLLNVLPFSKRVIKIWQEMLGVTNKEKKIAFKVNRKTKFKVGINFLKYLIHCEDNMEKLNILFEVKYINYLKFLNYKENTSYLLGVYNMIMDDMTYFWDLTLINDMYTFINTSLSGKSGKKYLSGIKSLESMKPIDELNCLIDKFNKLGDDNEEYLTAEKEYIDKYGDRCIGELKLETQTYRTNPETLRKYIKDHSDKITHNRFENNIIIKENKRIRKAKSGISNRELSRLARTRIFGLARHIFLKIGKNLKEAGIISDERDVFYLHLNELTSETNLDKLISERKALYSAYEKLPSYTRLEFNDKVINKNPYEISNSDMFTSSNELVGIPTSLGKVTGEVLVVDKPTITTNADNKIIVTESTDPGWVFLIKDCLGVIAERGSLLSHTAIVTRELKKPSVVNVKGAMSKLKTGDIVEIDAYTGKITCMEKVKI